MARPGTWIRDVPRVERFGTVAQTITLNDYVMVMHHWIRLGEPDKAARAARAAVHYVHTVENLRTLRQLRKHLR